MALNSWSSASSFFKPCRMYLKSVLKRCRSFTDLKTLTGCRSIKHSTPAHRSIDKSPNWPCHLVILPCRPFLLASLVVALPSRIVSRSLTQECLQSDQLNVSCSFYLCPFQSGEPLLHFHRHIASDIARATRRKKASSGWQLLHVREFNLHLASRSMHGGHKSNENKKDPDREDEVGKIFIISLK